MAEATTLVDLQGLFEQLGLVRADPPSESLSWCAVVRLCNVCVLYSRGTVTTPEQDTCII
jgi:hypothetical protein